MDGEEDLEEAVSEHMEDEKRTEGDVASLGSDYDFSPIKGRSEDKNDANEDIEEAEDENGEVHEEDPNDDFPNEELNKLSKIENMKSLSQETDNESFLESEPLNKSLDNYEEEEEEEKDELERHSPHSDIIENVNEEGVSDNDENHLNELNHPTSDVEDDLESPFSMKRVSSRQELQSHSPHVLGFDADTAENLPQTPEGRVNPESILQEFLDDPDTPPNDNQDRASEDPFLALKGDLIDNEDIEKEIHEEGNGDLDDVFASKASEPMETTFLPEPYKQTLSNEMDDHFALDGHFDHNGRGDGRGKSTDDEDEFVLQLEPKGTNEPSGVKYGTSREPSSSHRTPSTTSSISLGMKTIGESSRPSDPLDDNRMSSRHSAGSYRSGAQAPKRSKNEDMSAPEDKIIYRQLVEAAKEKDATKVRFIYSAVTRVDPSRWQQYLDYLQPEERTFITLTATTSNGIPYSDNDHIHSTDNDDVVEDVIQRSYFVPLYKDEEKKRDLDVKYGALSSALFSTFAATSYTHDVNNSFNPILSSRSTGGTNIPSYGPYPTLSSTTPYVRPAYGTLDSGWDSAPKFENEISRIQQDLERLRQGHYRRPYRVPGSFPTTPFKLGSDSIRPIPVKATIPYETSYSLTNNSQPVKLAGELVQENRRIRRTVENLQKRDEIREDVLRQMQSLVDELRGEILRLSKRIHEQRYTDQVTSKEFNSAEKDANLLRQVMQDYRQLSTDYERMQTQVQQAWTEASDAERSTWEAERLAQSLEKELQRLKDENARLRRQSNAGNISASVDRNDKFHDIRPKKTLSSLAFSASQEPVVTSSRSYYTAKSSDSYSKPWIGGRQDGLSRTGRILSQSMVELRHSFPDKYSSRSASTLTRSHNDRLYSSNTLNSKQFARSSENVTNIEKRYDELQWKKRDVERALSHLPSTGRVLVMSATDRLSAMQKQEQLERKLHRIEREIGSLRLKLRQANVLFVK